METIALAVAGVDGVPPVIATVGGEWYPAPPCTIWMREMYPAVAVTDAVTVGPAAGLFSPIRSTLASVPFQRKPRPIPSTPYRSLKRPLKNVIGRKAPVYA